MQIELIDRNEVCMRPMTAGDLPVVVEINKACFIRPYPDFWFRSYLEESGKAGVVADYKGLVVGLMLYENLPEHIYLACLAVQPYFQGFHVGTRLVRWLQSQLSQLGKSVLELHVYSLDLIPVALYQKTDFQLVKEVPGFYSDGVSAYLMRYESC